MRRAFGWALFVGVALSIVAQTAVETQWLVIAPPLAAMGLYIWWYRREASRREHVRTFADSLYYLGFAYTLLSLLFGLLPSVYAGELDPALLLGRLSIALSTTIVGLVGRVLFIQFLPDDERAVQDATRALVDSTNLITANVSNFLEEIRSLEQVISGALKTNGEHLDQAMGEMVELSKRSLEESSQAFLENTAEAKVAAQEMAKTFRSARQSAAMFQGEIESSTDELRALSESVSQARGTLETLGDAQSLTENIRSSLEELRLATAATVEPAGQASDALDVIIDAWRSTATGMEETRSILASFSQRVSESTRELEQTVGVSSEIATQLSTLANAASLASSELGKVRVATDGLNSASQAAQTFSEKATSASDALEQLSAYQLETERIDQSFDDLVRYLDSLRSRDLEQVTADLVANLERSGNDVVRLESTVGSVLQRLSQKLEKLDDE